MNEHASESKERRVVLCLLAHLMTIVLCTHSAHTHTNTRIHRMCHDTKFISRARHCLICRSQFDLAVSECGAISITSVDNRVAHVFAGYSICQTDYSVSSSKSTCVDLQLEIRVTFLFRTLAKINKTYLLYPIERT